MSNEPSESVEFNDLMFLALDHGFASIEDCSGPLIPFVIAKTAAGEREMHRFVCEKLEESSQKAKEYIEAEKSNLQIYALAWDGYITLDGKKWDAILVEAGERGNEFGLLMCQRYEKKGFIKKKNHKVGNPVLIEKPKSIIFVKTMA